MKNQVDAVLHNLPAESFHALFKSNRDDYQHPKTLNENSNFYELQKTVHKTSEFHIETIASSAILSITERLMLSCINTIKINWVVCERTKKSCNLIMIIALIWCDDNFSIWCVRPCWRASVRNKIVGRQRKKEKNLHNPNFECYWRNNGNCDGQTSTYDLLMSFHRRKKTVASHVKQKDTNRSTNV